MGILTTKYNKNYLLHHIFYGLITLMMSLAVQKGNAQPRVQDVVYLENGWVIRGKIMENSTSDSLRIACFDGNIFVFDRAKVKQVKKEPVYKQSLTGGKSLSRLYAFTEVSIIAGNGNTSRTVSPWFTTGYRFGKHLGLGLGVGLHRFTNITFLPVVADMRIMARQDHHIIRPYGYFSAGYGLSGLNDADLYVSYKGGLNWTAGFGLMAPISPLAKINWGLGITVQEGGITYTDPVDPENALNYSVNIRRLEFRMGVHF